MFILSCKLKETFRCLPKGFRIDFKPLTLLVGEQGSGKSSLLGLMKEQSSKIEIELTDEARTKGVPFFFFDSEKMNPRIKDPHTYDSNDGFKTSLFSRFNSHGEVHQKIMFSTLGDGSSTILIVDEPETALSIKNQVKLANRIEKSLANNCQIIIATHNLILMERFPEVYSMEHRQWMASSDYLETQGYRR